MEYMKGLLKENDEILLKDNDGGITQFRILECMGEDHSLVSYEAILLSNDKKASSGLLKEFYPSDYPEDSFVRENNQLILNDMSKHSEFFQARGTFENNLLEFIKQRNANVGNLLYQYLPECEMFESIVPDRTKEGTAYAWIPNKATGIGLSDYFNTAKQNINENQKLDYVKKVLEAVKELTKCVNTLHTIGYYHLDLSPEKLLVKTDNNHIHAKDIRLFDISSLYKKGDHITIDSSYSAPEVREGKDFDERADLYSLGVILEEALLDHPYHEEDYTQLSEYIIQSVLLSSSLDYPLNALQSDVLEILNKTLNKECDQRYADGQSLMNVLEKAIQDADDIMKNEHVYTVEKMACRRQMSDLLFDYPMYSYLDDEKTLRVLVVGNTQPAYEFMNVVLQAGQLIDTQLKITAVSHDGDAFEKDYLKDKPALADFVDITSFSKSVKNSYAKLEFKTIAQYDEASLYGVASADYILVAEKEDSDNIKVMKVLRALAPHAFIAYLLQSELEHQEDQVNTVVLPANQTNAQKVDSQLEKMAFNVHLTWEMETSHAIDMNKAVEHFKEPYNKASSIASALTIPYKLYSIGMILSKDDLSSLSQEQIQAIRQVITHKQEKTFKELVYLEHRRWVLEKAIDGYQPFPKNKHNETMLYTKETYEQFVQNGHVKDAAHKLHGCMVPSTVDMPLLNDDAKAWKLGVKGLDPLDTLSMKIYTYTKEMITDLNAEAEIGKVKAAILDEIDSNDHLKNAFDAFTYCITQMMDENIGSTNFTDQYFAEYQTFKDAARKDRHSSASKRAAILGDLEKLNSYAKLYVLRNHPINYKNKDVTIIRNMLFILRYQARPTLTMALDLGDNNAPVATDLYKNVASATILQPGHIYYFYHYDGRLDVDKLKEKLKRIMAYYQEVRMGAMPVDIAIGYRQDCHEAEALEKLVKTLNISQLTIHLEKYEKEEDFSTYVAKTLIDLQDDHYVLYDMSTSLFHSHFLESMYLRELSDAGNSLVNNFDYDAKTQTFHNIYGCDYLEDNIYHPSLKIDAMLAINGQERKNHHEAGLSGVIDQLWNIYTKSSNNGDNKKRYQFSVSNWTTLTGEIRKHSEYENVIYCVQIDDLSTAEFIEETYTIRTTAFGLLNASLKAFKKVGLVESYELTKNTGVSFTYKVKHYQGLKKVFNEIVNRQNKKPFYKEKYNLNNLSAKNVFFSQECFNHPERLDAQKIVADYHTYYELTYRHHEISMHFEVEDCQNKFFEVKKYEGMVNILNKLNEKRMVNDYHYQWHNNDHTDLTVNFIFANEAVADVLSKEGEILEVYTYYKARETHYFDDLAQGIEFGLKDSRVKNEMDCILTKGQRVMFVECKARTKLEQNFFYKLKCLSDHYGIEPICVLVTNQYNQFNDDYNGNAENEMQEERGNDLDVIVIKDLQELNQIGSTLKKIMQR